MKTFLTLFVLLFSSSVVADDISDFEIEGMSIGDSLLDYYSESQINEPDRIKKAFNYNDKYIQIGFKESKFTTYKQIAVVFKKNNKYIIHALQGRIFFDNFEDCYEKKDEIVSELSSLYNNENFKKKTSNNEPHSFDKSGKSRVTSVVFFLNKGGGLGVTCTDWSEEFEEYEDHLSVQLRSEEFIDFLTNDFY